MGTILQNHYVLAVHDLRVSSQFFLDLGFQIYKEPEGWIFVKKDNCMIMLGECQDAIAPQDLGDHSYFAYLRVDNADEYFQELKNKGVKTSPIETKSWGMREFALRTPEGHRLMIGQRIDS